MPINLSIEYPKLQNEVIKLRSQNESLIDIAKRCLFIFDNEANYPEGTMGYRLAQDAKAAIQKVNANT